MPPAAERTLLVEPRDLRMTLPVPADFVAFFKAVHDGREPFPWQRRLAERVCGGGRTPGEWPRCIALPTASGKTACIDIAVFALACQATLSPELRSAPRRIFFVVDRRVVVDQALDHAKALSDALRSPKDEILSRVAEGLVRVGADPDRPLDVYALRGGMYRESAWVRSPLQPTVITSTVDQVGSRLLFRGYGVSDSAKPLHAALVGNDALILLDEAHCARPFDQTMMLVKKYREWSDGSAARLGLPFQFAAMTATPGGEVLGEERRRSLERPGTAPLIFEPDEKDLEPGSPLGRRLAASKRARLVIAHKAKGSKWRSELVVELVKQARQFRAGGASSVGVIVNRVATAREVAARLRSELNAAADIVLLTGRMRPVDRDAVLTTIKPLLSGSTVQPVKPTFVVATQTLEVGADLDFHALVTECASLDALRQRFGRLNRVAARPDAEAVIVVRADQSEPSDDSNDGDPVYGHSLANTWQWLNKVASDGPLDAKVVDFGVAAIGKLLADPSTRPDDASSLNAPSNDASVLLPAHLDLWCQTSPRPVPDPDPSHFLHGARRGEPEVQVAFRVDLGTETDQWAEIVSLCPPSSSETFSVRLRDFRKWLAGLQPDDRAGDVEGERSPDEDEDDQEAASPAARRVLRWRGPDSRETVVVDDATDLTPNDTYVVPVASDEQRAAAAVLGDFPAGHDGSPHINDAGDRAFLKARDKAILRLRHDLYPVLPAAYDALDPDLMDDDEVATKVSHALDLLRNASATGQHDLLRSAVEELGIGRHRTVKRHPAGGLVLAGKRRLHQFDPTFTEAEDSWEPASERPYPLHQHCDDVAERSKDHAEQAGLGTLATAFELAGKLHDAGKADPRFQAWLHGGNARRAEMCGTLYAKSVVSFTSRREWTVTRDRAGYPIGARHELLSVRLAEQEGALPAKMDEARRDLILHLIASHHGACRPFARAVEDPAPVPFAYRHEGVELKFVPDSSASGHGLERLDSGTADRFWALNDRFGWWGLPYLEALIRLADWACGEPREPAAIPAPRVPRTAAKQEHPS